MKSNKPQVILILMFVLLFLIVLFPIVLNLRKENKENFQGGTYTESGTQDLFENTYDFL